MAGENAPSAPDGQRPPHLPPYREDPFGRDAFEDDAYAFEPYEKNRRRWMRFAAVAWVGLFLLFVGGIVGVPMGKRAAGTLLDVVTGGDPAYDPAYDPGRRPPIVRDPLASLSASALRRTDNSTASLPMGATVGLRDGAGNEALLTLGSPRWRKRPCGDLVEIEPGARILQVDVAVQVVNGTVDISETHFGLASGGTIYSAIGGIMTGCGEPLDTTGAKAGDRVSGRLAIVSDTTSGEVRFQPLVVVSEPSCAWTLG